MSNQFKVLIAEDDLLIADMVEDRLIIAGFEVCGIATNVAEGIALAIQHQPDIAIIDVRLANGDLGTTLAVELKRLLAATAVLYATGNVDFVLNDVIGEACITKPYSLKTLCQSLTILGNMMRTGVIETALPEGLIMLDHGARKHSATES
jgi:DNA-binding response OmpR family regulator